MALVKTYLGDNEDGTPHFRYAWEGKGKPHLLLTGPDSSGVVHADDGTAYDVTPLVVAVASHEHAQQLAGRIEKQLIRRGLHPAHKALAGATGDEKQAAQSAVDSLPKADN